MLIITITEPHTLRNNERVALLMLLGEAPPAGVEIAPEDMPSTGMDPAFAEIVSTLTARVERPTFGTEISDARSPGEPLIVEAVGPNADMLDPAAIFGAAVSPSVPLPPFVPLPVPPAPLAAADSFPASVPAPIAAVRSAGVTLDSKGLPWDARIHASTKGTNADGGWKRRKNIFEIELNEVEAELRDLLSVPSPAGAASPPAAETPKAFSVFMTWLTQQVAAGHLLQTDVSGAVAPMGLTSVVGLNMRPDLIPQVRASLEALIAAKEAV